MREWVVYRRQTVTHVYAGIKAEDSKSALEAFYRGEGDMDANRSYSSEWQLEAMDVAEDVARKMRAGG